jgi:hypothetical protein
MNAPSFMQRSKNEVCTSSIQVMDALDIADESSENEISCNETPHRATLSPLF